MARKSVSKLPDSVEQSIEIKMLYDRIDLLERVIKAYLKYQTCSDTGDAMGAGNAWQDFLDALNEAARSGDGSSK